MIKEGNSISWKKIADILKRYLNGDYYPEKEEEKKIVDMLVNIGVLEFGLDLDSKNPRLKVNKEYIMLIKSEEKERRSILGKIGDFLGSIGLKFYN